MDIAKMAENLKKLREDHKLTQEALAEKINLSAKSLSQIELGNNFVSAETLEEICSALNIPPKTLFDFEYSELSQENSIKEIVTKLENNPKLLKTIYKIVSVLDY